MIDYLERLFEQEQEEELEGFLWPRVKARYAVSAEKEEEKRSAEETSAAEREEQNEQTRDPMQRRRLGVTEDWETVLAGVMARVGQLGKRGVERGSAQMDAAQYQERRVEMEPAQKVDLEKTLVELGHAVARGTTGYVALARKQTPMGGMAEESERIGRRSAEQRLAPRRGLTHALDAAFERDARRYDGPLGLF